MLDLDVRKILCDAVQKRNALFGREHRMLGTVDHHADDQTVENTSCAPNDIEMPVCDRVKAAGIDRRFHRGCSKSLFLQ